MVWDYNHDNWNHPVPWTEFMISNKLTKINVVDVINFCHWPLNLTPLLKILHVYMPVAFYAILHSTRYFQRQKIWGPVTRHKVLSKHGPTEVHSLFGTCCMYLNFLMKWIRYYTNLDQQESVALSWSNWWHFSWFYTRTRWSSDVILQMLWVSWLTNNKYPDSS